METSEKKLVFIVDDDPLYSKVMSEFFTKEIPHLEVKLFSTGEACLHEMYLNPVAVILDYYLDSEFEYAWNGIQILKKILLAYPSSNIIIISAQENMETALNCVKQGALEYVIKNEKALWAIKKTLLDVIDDTVEY